MDHFYKLNERLIKNWDAVAWDTVPDPADQTDPLDQDIGADSLARFLDRTAG